jgi:hypothetical protein
MKTTIILSDGVKQINLTPENDQEREALKMFTVDDNINLAVQQGSFGEERFKPFQIDVNRCVGGHLRAYDNKDSIMLVLTPKDKPTTK